MSSPNLYLEAAKLEIEMIPKTYMHFTQKHSVKILSVVPKKLTEDITVPLVRFKDLQTNIENELPIERFKELFGPV